MGVPTGCMAEFLTSERARFIAQGLVVFMPFFFPFFFCNVYIQPHVGGVFVLRVSAICSTIYSDLYQRIRAMKTRGGAKVSPLSSTMVPGCSHSFAGDSHTWVEPRLKQEENDSERLCAGHVFESGREYAGGCFRGRVGRRWLSYHRGTPAYLALPWKP